MKICIVSRTINKKGGVSRYYAELAEQFCKEHEVHMLVARYENKYKNNFIVHPYSIPQNPYVLEISASFIKVSTLAKKLDEKFGFEVIHASEAEGLYQNIITAHSCIRGAFEKLNKNNFFYDFLRRVRPFTLFGLTAEKLVYSHHKYKKIIAVSGGVKKEIMNYYNVPDDEIVIIPNGVNIEEFKPDEKSKMRVREKYGIREDEIVLMFSGYEFKRKGLRYIIEALPLMERNLKLLVVGKSDPKPFQNLANKLGVSDNLIFTGFVPEIKDYYAASDIYVFPTAYEPFGLVITEAMACGLPVITSKSAGAAELISDGCDGLLLNEPSNVDEIAGKIKLMVEDESLRRHMCRNARKTAENYSWDEIAKRTMEVYEEVAKR